MNHRQAGKLAYRAALWGVIIIILSNLITVYHELLAYIVMAAGFFIAMAGLIISYKFARCPKCSKYIGISIIKTNYCPACGEKL